MNCLLQGLSWTLKCLRHRGAYLQGSSKCGASVFEVHGNIGLGLRQGRACSFHSVLQDAHMLTDVLTRAHTLYRNSNIKPRSVFNGLRFKRVAYQGINLTGQHIDGLWRASKCMQSNIPRTTVPSKPAMRRLCLLPAVWKSAWRW